MPRTFFCLYILNRLHRSMLVLSFPFPSNPICCVRQIGCNCRLATPHLSDVSRKKRPARCRWKIANSRSLDGENGSACQNWASSESRPRSTRALDRHRSTHLTLRISSVMATNGSVSKSIRYNEAPRKRSRSKANCWSLDLFEVPAERQRFAL